MRYAGIPDSRRKRESPQAGPGPGGLNANACIFLRFIRAGASMRDNHRLRDRHGNKKAHAGAEIRKIEKNEKVLDNDLNQV